MYYFLQLNISLSLTPPPILYLNKMTPKPTFTFCDIFSNKNIILVIQCIKNLEFELKLHTINSIIIVLQFLILVNLLLTDKVAQWVETNANIVQILAISKPNNVNITTFKNLFEEKFPVEVVKNLFVSLDLEFSKLY